MWGWVYLYGSFVTMLYVHDPWASFGISVIFLMVEELVTAFCVLFGFPYYVGHAWDPGSISFVIFFELCGISIAILTILILETPRLVRAPYEELNQLDKEYNITLVDETKKKIFSYKREDYRWLRIKYSAQIFLVLGTSYASAFLTKDDKDSLFLGPEWGRSDWMIFTIGQFALLILFFFWNRKSEIEQKILWCEDEDAYFRLYGIWFCILLMIVLPGIYFYLPGKIGTLISMVMIVILLLVVSIYLYWIKRSKSFVNKTG